MCLAQYFKCMKSLNLSYGKVGYKQVILAGFILQLIFRSVLINNINQLSTANELLISILEKNFLSL